VNTSIFSLMSEKVEGNAFYRGYSGEKCPLSRSPIIVDPMNFFTLPRGQLRELTLRQFVPLAITDNIAANNDRLKLDLTEVRVHFMFAGTGGHNRFWWFGDVVEVGSGLGVSNETLSKLGIIPKQTQNKFVSINIISLKVDEKALSRGKTMRIRYEVFCSADVSGDIWLGASLLYKNGKSVWNTRQDKPVSLLRGTREYDRDLTIPNDAPLGGHMLLANVWQGPLSDGKQSSPLTNGGRVEISVVA
jgi:hypothetical protein